jgi:hypothetical protein
MSEHNDDEYESLLTMGVMIGVMLSALFAVFFYAAVRQYVWGLYASSLLASVIILSILSKPRPKQEEHAVLPVVMVMNSILTRMTLTLPVLTGIALSLGSGQSFIRAQEAFRPLLAVTIYACVISMLSSKMPPHIRVGILMIAGLAPTIIISSMILKGNHFPGFFG